MVKIAVAGLGYVGMSSAALLAQHNEVIATDINEERVNQVNNKQSTIKDNDIATLLASGKLNLRATTDWKEAFKDAEYVIVAVPTDFDYYNYQLDTSAVDEVIEEVLSVNKKAIIVIKSTVSIGYTDSQMLKHQTDNIMFSPEFLREGKALYDNLYPSRIVIGFEYYMKESAHKYVDLLNEAAAEPVPEEKCVYTLPHEAEAIKIFSNTYLAMRVAFFNEIDNYAILKNLRTSDVIKGMSLDPRIGDYYNNPSFGYGGYCLPKDTKQAASGFGVSSPFAQIIQTISSSNQSRKMMIVSDILKSAKCLCDTGEPITVGVYRLNMKSDSDNSRNSAIFDIIEELSKNRSGRIEVSNIIVYEPSIADMKCEGLEVVNNINIFADRSTIIIANRYDQELDSVRKKVYTRDVFFRD